MGEYLEDDVAGGCISGNERRWRCLIHLSKLLHEGTPLEELLMITTQQHHKSSTNTTTYNDHHHHDFLDHKGSFFKKGKRSPRKKKSIFINPDHEVQLTSLKITMIKKMCTTTLSNKIITMIKSDTSSSNAQLLHYLGKRRSRSTDHDSQNQEKKRAAMKKVKVPETSPRQLPQEFKNHILDIGGCLEKLVLVIEKRLFKTDVSSLHNRLSVPYSQVVNPFLEQSDVDDLDHTPKAEIKATLVQPCLKECEISLRNWKTNNQYALVTRWNEICYRNGLKEGMIIQLWAFRKISSSQLCFALLKID